MSEHKRYTATEMHWKLIERQGFRAIDLVDTSRQAYACPYYVPLSGVLGSDWGVNLNPESERFGELLFEHDDCGCVGDCPRGNQRANRWLKREAT